MTLNGAGAWLWLPQDSPLRPGAARLNPMVHPATEAHPEGRVEELAASSPRPEQKDVAYMRSSAAAGDASYREGKQRGDALHKVKSTGVLASHPFMKIVYWDDALMRQPDPMHTIGGELKALVDMVMGGSGRVPAYSAAQIPKLAQYEAQHNKRWTEALTPFLPGELCIHQSCCLCGR